LILAGRLALKELAAKLDWQPGCLGKAFSGGGKWLYYW
jgi:hypothetical protein